MLIVGYRCPVNFLRNVLSGEHYVVCPALGLARCASRSSEGESQHPGESVGGCRRAGPWPRHDMVEELTYREALLPLKYLVVNATSTAEYCPLSMTKWPEASLPAPVIRGWALASHGGGIEWNAPANEARGCDAILPENTRPLYFLFGRHLCPNPPSRMLSLPK